MMKRFRIGLRVAVLTTLFLNQPFLYSADGTVVSGDPVDPDNITMNFDNVPLRDVLNIFSKLSGYSFVANADQQERHLSVYLENVPMKLALDSLVKANNLRYEQVPDSKVIIFLPADATVAEAKLEMRVVHLKFMRLSSSAIDIGGRTVRDGLSSTTSLGATGASTAGAAGATKEDERGVDKMVQKLLSKRGLLTIDLPTNSLIIIDTAEKLKEITDVLERLDMAPDQVLLEVYLVEVSNTKQTLTGVSWGGADGQIVSFTGGTRTTGFPFTESVFNTNQGVKATTQPLSTLALGTLSATNFTATLRLILNDISSKILARPRVLTMNNEAANIRLITNTAIANTSTVSSGASLSTATTNVAERSETGIVLKMTPQINDDDTVALYVEPSITTVATSSFFPETFLDPTTRSVQTLARVRNHETLVIGGLIDQNKQGTIRKVPFLGDVPLIGNAFRNTDADDLNRELIIFITPHIYRGNEPLENKSAYERDLAVKRMLDQFMDQEILSVTAPIEDTIELQRPVSREDKKLIDASVKRAKLPEAQKEMTHALDSFGGEKPKTESKFPFK
jgi:type IV pilus assembly protein PilQ